MKILKEKGITLVALVITIIVLLILAGVTLSLVLGDNGIIPRANESKEETIKAQVKEEIERKILEYRTMHEGEFDIDKFFLDEDNLLKDNFTIGIEEHALTSNNYKFYIDENGDIKDEVLPEGYIRCEYLESTGTQYIIPNIITSNDMILHLIISGNQNVTTTTQGFIFGCLNRNRCKIPSNRRNKSRLQYR